MKTEKVDVLEGSWRFSRTFKFALSNLCARFIMWLGIFRILFCNVFLKKEERRGRGKECDRRDMRGGRKKRERLDDYKVDVETMNTRCDGRANPELATINSKY